MSLEFRRRRPRADLAIPATSDTAMEHARWISAEVLRETKDLAASDRAAQNAFKMGAHLERLLASRKKA